MKRVFPSRQQFTSCRLKKDNRPEDSFGLIEQLSDLAAKRNINSIGG